MTGKYLFVLGRLPIALNHIPRLENNVMLTLHYAKIMELTQWKGHPPGFYCLIYLGVISIHMVGDLSTSYDLTKETSIKSEKGEPRTKP